MSTLQVFSIGFFLPSKYRLNVSIQLRRSFTSRCGSSTDWEGRYISFSEHLRFFVFSFFIALFVWFRAAD